MEGKETMFSKTAALISIGLAILGLIGVYIKPQSANFIITAIVVMVLVIFITGKMSQIDENSAKIKEIYKKLDFERRLGTIEKELSEQKGKLSMMGKRK